MDTCTKLDSADLPFFDGSGCAQALKNMDGALAFVRAGGKRSTVRVDAPVVPAFLSPSRRERGVNGLAAVDTEEVFRFWQLLCVKF